MEWEEADVERFRFLDTVEALGEIRVAIEAPPLLSPFGPGPNYPNPFYDRTTIPFDVTSASEGYVRITVYDLQGRRIANLFERSG